MSTATSTSVPPTTYEASTGSRRGQTTTTPSRTPSARTRPSAVPPSPQRVPSSHSRQPTRPVEDILPQRDYETTNVAQSTRRRSTDRPPAVRAESSRSASGHHRSSSRQHYAPSDMSGTTASNGGGPAPIVTPIESRHSTSKTGRGRTTIPAKTGNWVLGKTIGAGSMGKVKLARRVEGGEQVRYSSVNMTGLLASGADLVTGSR